MADPIDFSSPFAGVGGVPEQQRGNEFANLAPKTDIMEKLKEQMKSAPAQPQGVTEKRVLELIQKNQTGGGGLTIQQQRFIKGLEIKKTGDDLAPSQSWDDVPEFENGGVLINEATQALLNRTELVIRNVDSADELRSLSANRLTDSVFILSADGGLFRRDPTDTTSAEDGGDYCGTVIRPSDYATRGVFKRDYDGVMLSDWFAPDKTGLSDCHAELTAALNAAEGKAIRITDGRYLVSAPVFAKSNSVVYFDSEAWLVPSVPMPAVFGVQYSNVRVENPHIDCDEVAGCNGIGIGGSTINDVTDVHLVGPVIINARREPDGAAADPGGGRGIQVETRVYGVRVDSPLVKDSDCGISSQGSIAFPTDRVTFNNPVIMNCGHAIEAFDLADQANTPASSAMGGVVVNGGFAYNCGRPRAELYSGIGVYDPATDSGVIMGERARWLTVNNFRCHNDASYGKVGALWRGTGFHIKLNDCELIGDARALIDCTVDATLLPIGYTSLPAGLQTIQSRDMVFNVKGAGTYDYLYRCQTPSGISLGHLGHRMKAVISGTITNLIDVPSGRTDAHLTVYHTDTGEMLSGNFSNLITSAGNVMLGAGVRSYENEVFKASVSLDSIVLMTGLPTAAPGTQYRVFRIDRGDGTSDLRIKN